MRLIKSCFLSKLNMKQMSRV